MRPPPRPKDSDGQHVQRRRDTRKPRHGNGDASGVVHRSAAGASSSRRQVPGKGSYPVPGEGMSFKTREKKRRRKIATANARAHAPRERRRAATT